MMYLFIPKYFSCSLKYTYRAQFIITLTELAKHPAVGGPRLGSMPSSGVLLCRSCCCHGGDNCREQPGFRVSFSPCALYTVFSLRGQFTQIGYFAVVIKYNTSFTW